MSPHGEAQYFSVSAYLKHEIVSKPAQEKSYFTSILSQMDSLKHVYMNVKCSVSALSDLGIPFSQWTKEQVCGWLEDYGLGQYVNLTRQWVENGQTLLSATPQEIEKVRGQLCTIRAGQDRSLLQDSI